MPVNSNVFRLPVRAAGICLFLAACATPQTDNLREHPGVIAPHADIADAPFFAQRTKECGPAALAMAMAASGLRVSPDALVDEIYTPNREGSLTTDLIAGTRRHGRLAYRIEGMRDLFMQVAAGRPVIVLQNLALEVLPQWHYAVVVGYDLANGTLTLHSGKTARLKMPMATFERTWERADNWALLVLTPGELPADPDIGRYLKATAGLELAKQFVAAETAYAAGLRRWPDNIPTALGVGNALFAMGRTRAAAVSFERITQAHPTAADAFNNLAHVRRELGDLAKAESAARRAVALGGPNIDIYRETLESIRGRKAGSAPAL